MRTEFTILIFFIFIQCTLHAQPEDSGILKNKNFLVYTKNGKGFVHDNIPACITAFQKLGRKLNFSVDTTENPNIFSDEKLKKYDAIIFANTNNDVFDTEAQKVAFMRYIQAGGGFVGIHSATGTERNWKWFKLMIGATFLRHPPLQPYTVHVLDPVHPATKSLQQKWDTIDESYYFKEINPSIKVLLYSDLSQVKESGNGKHTKPDVFGNRYPVAWCHMFDGGKIWYTSLGHNKEDYENPVYLAHLIEGLKWVADKGKLDYKKAYATSSTEINEIEIY